MDLSNTHFHGVQSNRLHIILARVWLCNESKDIEKGCVEHRKGVNIEG